MYSQQIIVILLLSFLVASCSESEEVYVDAFPVECINCEEEEGVSSEKESESTEATEQAENETESSEPTEAESDETEGTVVVDSSTDDKTKETSSSNDEESIEPNESAPMVNGHLPIINSNCEDTVQVNVPADSNGHIFSGDCSTIHVLPLKKLKLSVRSKYVDAFAESNCEIIDSSNDFLEQLAAKKTIEQEERAHEIRVALELGGVLAGQTKEEMIARLKTLEEQIKFIKESRAKVKARIIEDFEEAQGSFAAEVLYTFSNPTDKLVDKYREMNRESGLQVRELRSEGVIVNNSSVNLPGVVDRSFEGSFTGRVELLSSEYCKNKPEGELDSHSAKIFAKGVYKVSETQAFVRNLPSMQYNLDKFISVLKQSVGSDGVVNSNTLDSVLTQSLSWSNVDQGSKNNQMVSRLFVDQVIKYIVKVNLDLDSKYDILSVLEPSVESTCSYYYCLLGKKGYESVLSSLEDKNLMSNLKNNFYFRHGTPSGSDSISGIEIISTNPETFYNIGVYQ